MIDLETLGTVSNTVITSIGAVLFDSNGRVIDEFHSDVSMASCVDLGMKIDPATMSWWMGQSKVAQAHIVLPDETKRTLGEALLHLSDFLHEVAADPSETRVWGNGASFDNSMMQYSYKLVGEELPWKFWNDRCFRTVKNICGHIKPDPRLGTHHDALDDAKHQASHLIKISRAYPNVLDT